MSGCILWHDDLERVLEDLNHISGKGGMLTLKSLLLGATYAILQAGDIERVAGIPRFTAERIAGEVETLQKTGRISPEWIAGYHLISAMHRICDAGENILLQLVPHEGKKKPGFEFLIREAMGFGMISPECCEALHVIREEINMLKHEVQKVDFRPAKSAEVVLALVELVQLAKRLGTQ